MRCVHCVHYFSSLLIGLQWIDTNSLKRNTEFRGGGVVVTYILQRDSKRQCRSRNMSRGVSYCKAPCPCGRAVSQVSLPGEWVGLAGGSLPRAQALQGAGLWSATSEDLRPRGNWPGLLRLFFTETLQPLAGSRVFKFYSPILTGFSGSRLSVHVPRVNVGVGARCSRGGRSGWAPRGGVLRDPSVGGRHPPWQPAECPALELPRLGAPGSLSLTRGEHAFLSFCSLRLRPDPKTEAEVNWKEWDWANIHM